MSEQYRGGPAFPTTPENYEQMEPEGSGMTLRDYVIIAMMAAWRQSEAGTELESRLSSGLLATLASEDADAMLAERSHNGQTQN